jgi:hypothetical protein
MFIIKPRKLDRIYRITTGLTGFCFPEDSSNPVNPEKSC